MSRTVIYNIDRPLAAVMREIANGVHEKSEYDRIVEEIRKKADNGLFELVIRVSRANDVIGRLKSAGFEITEFASRVDCDFIVVSWEGVGKKNFLKTNYWGPGRVTKNGYDKSKIRGWRNDHFRSGSWPFGLGKERVRWFKGDLRFEVPRGPDRVGQ